jgi:hypothetical protein
MDIELFKSIINKSKEYKKINNITFNSFNEPLADPLFKDRVRLLQDSEIKLILNTNGSLLTKDLLSLLKDLQVVNYISFNLPAVDDEELKYITGFKNSKKIIDIIHKTIDYGFDVNISINGFGKKLNENFEKIKEEFQKYMKRNITINRTVDRLGTVKNEYYQNIYNEGLLGGCNRILKWIYIGIKGNCFLCCHDFNQVSTYADINNHSIDEIVEMQKPYRKIIFGGEESDNEFICRHCFDMKNNIIINKIKYTQIMKYFDN